MSQFCITNHQTGSREEIYRWMGGRKTPLQTNVNGSVGGVDVPALVDAIRNDDVEAEQLRIGSGCVLFMLDLWTSTDFGS